MLEAQVSINRESIVDNDGQSFFSKGLDACRRHAEFATGQLVSSTRAGQRIDWKYDGVLPVRETSSGVVAGSISRSYDEDFRVVEVAINDAGVAYAYDNDGLLTSAGRFQ
jgi:hypothetical protein